MDVPTYAETLFITDAAINIVPDLDAKRDIVQNAIDLFTQVGLGTPRVAILSAVETVTTKIPSTIEAAALCKMADRGQITGGMLDGPLAFDNAIDPEAARIKGISSAVAGRAQILVVPDLEAGNMLAKNLTFLAKADAAGIVLGARVPIILTSRADSVRTRMASCAVAALYAHAAPHRRAAAGGVTAMDPILVVNAGSSSVKFQVFAIEGPSELTLQIKGQVDGIGTRPRLRARGAWRDRARRPDASNADEIPDVPAALADGGRLAAPALRHRCRSRLAIASCMAVPNTTGRSWSTPSVLDDLAAIRSARAAASAQQSGADPRDSRALVRSCRRSRASTPLSTAATARSPTITRCRSSFYAEGVRRYGFHGLSYEYIAASPAARSRRTIARRTRHRRASGQRRLDVRAWRTDAASRARWASRRSTACRWERGPASSIPASCCI